MFPLSFPTSITFLTLMSLLANILKSSGRRFSDASIRGDVKLWPFKVFAAHGGKPMINVEYKGEEKQFAAEEISSMVLMKMA